MVNNTHII